MAVGVAYLAFEGFVSDGSLGHLTSTEKQASLRNLFASESTWVGLDIWEAFPVLLPTTEVLQLVGNVLEKASPFLSDHSSENQVQPIC